MKGFRAFGLAAVLLLIFLAAWLFVRLYRPIEPSSPPRPEAAGPNRQSSQPSQGSPLPSPSVDPSASGSKGEAGFVASGGGRRSPGELRRHLPVLAVLAVDRSTDEPLADAVVALHETQRSTSKADYLQEFTDLDGIARFELPGSGHYYVSVSCEGYLIGGEPFRYDAADGDLVKKISMIPAYTVRGRVRNQFGQPIDGAQVSFFLPEEPLVVLESDPEGRFEVVLSEGRYRVTAAKHPHVAAELYPLAVGSRRLQEIELVIQEQAERVVLSGRILDLHGRPISLARISLTDLSRPSRGSFDAESVSSSFLGVAAADAQGRFQLETVPRARVLAEIEAHAFQPQQQTLSLLGSQGREFRLEPYPSFVVRAVSAEGEELPIDSGRGDGGMVVVGVNAEGQQVTGPVNRPGLSGESSGSPLFFAREYPFDIYAFDRTGQQGITGRVHVGAHRSEITLVADQSARLQGHVSDRQGNPVQHFVVTYQSGLVQATRLIESEKGEFELLKLPEGPCTIQIQSPDHEGYSAEMVLQASTPAFLQAIVAERQGAGF